MLCRHESQCARLQDRQFDCAPRSCEYCTLAMCAICNLASYPHSIEHSNHLAYMQRTYAPPNHKPTGNLSLQIIAKGCAFTIVNIGNKMIHTLVMVNMNFHQTNRG